MVPRFHEIGHDVFEDLCRELVQEEDNVTSAERYGTLGQSQFGVDLLIDYKDGSLGAGQCKSHQSCDEALVREACDDFLKHAAHWRREGIRTFILFLAADTRRTQLHDERLKQRARLEQEGFSLQVWSAAVLKKKLRKQRQIVRHFFPWLEDYICGPSAELDIQSYSQRATIAALAKQFGEVAEGEHADLRKLWQEGHPRKALSKLRKIKNETLTWEVLPPVTKAKLLRLEGRLLLTFGEVATAKSLATEADQLDGSDSSGSDPGRARLVAMLAQADGRLDDALRVLEEETDFDSQALRAALQIQHGDVAAALDTLSSLEDHPEAYWLRSVVFLSQREPLKAKAEAEKALSLAPSGYWIRRTAAAIRYLAGISPVALPNGVPDWLQPINPMFVRQDDESIAARRSAAIEFEQLSGPEFEHSPDDIACIQACRVGCLADNADSREDAAELARDILDADPSNYRVMAWVLGRDLGVNIDPSIAALEKKVHHETADVEEIASLVGAFTSTGQFAKGRTVLDRTKELFIRDSAQPLWDFWQSQLTAIESRQEPSLDPETRLEQALTELRNAEAGREGKESWQQYMLLAQLGRWEEIAPVATKLVESLQTPDAVRIASYALYNTRDFSGCLAVLDEAPALFFGGEVPPDLRHLRVLAQGAIGALPEAIKTAREVFEQSPTRDAFLELCHLYVQVGDLKNFAIVARGHSSIGDLSAFDYLILASQLTIEDRTLALNLWRTAVDKGIDDDHVWKAFEIGNHLRLGVELKPLAHRLAELGTKGKGGVQAVGLKGLIDWSVQRREQLNQVWRRLQRGEVPNHVALGFMGTGLARAFHRIPLITATRTDGTSADPINQRFGGRIAGSLPVVRGQKWRLNADVTAILTAAHFDLLPRIEAEFAPIRLPQNTVIALSAMQNALRPAQPKYIEAQRHILSMVSARKIGRLDLDPITVRQDSEGDVADDVLKLLRDAIVNDSFVLDFLPPRSTDSMHPTQTLPAQYSALLRDAHSVLDALKHCGALSGPEHLQAIEALGQRHGLPDQAAIPSGKRLVCRSAVVRLLALADVLELAAATFGLVIPASDLDDDQREVDDAATADADVEWLGHLIDHLRDGLTTGTYTLLPQLDDRPLVSGEHKPTPEETVLFDLMQFASSESDVIWIDDRWVQSHEHRDGMRIVGTVDLLSWLRDAGKMSTTDFAQALNDMRAADVRFVAFDADELVAALRETSIEDGTLVETRTLRVLRQYYARCLLEADVLRPPTEGDEVSNTATEWNFLLGCGRAVMEAMVRVWDTGSRDHAIAQTEWLLNNMYTDDRGFHGTAAPRTEAKDAYRASASLTSLIVGSIPLDGQESLREARRDYLQWLHQRVIRGRFAADVDLARAVVEQLKETITHSLENDDEEMGAITLHLMGRLWLDLPNDLRKLMEPDQEFLRTLGISMRSIVDIGPLRVDEQSFWDTLSRVLKDRVPEEFTTLEGHPVRIELVSDSPILFSLHCDDLQFDGRIGGPELGFLSESFAEREATAANVKHWFDLPKSRRDELVTRIVAGHDPKTRVELATEARSASGAELYRRFYESIREGETFKPIDTMPSDVGLLIDHLRIDQAAPLSVRWMQSAEQLLSDVGVVEAAQRLGGLPIALPKVFVTKLAELPPTERRLSLRTIRKIWLASPVGLVHLAQLWKELPHVGRHATKVRDRLARALCSESHRHVFEAWLATLRWVDEQFGFNESARSLPKPIRLALVWSHADRVFRILRSRGLSPEWIENVFRQGDYAVAPELVFPDTAYSDDVAAPKRLGVEAFALSALKVVCTDASTEATVQTMLSKSLTDMSERGQMTVVRSMLTDTSRATNLLGSWLGNNRSWLVSLFPEETRKHYTVEEACAGIVGKNNEQWCWNLLGAILGDLPPSESTCTAVEKVLLNADVVDYIHRDPLLAVAVIGVMVSQASHVRSEVRARIETQILTAAAKLNDAELEAEKKEMISDLILAGLVGCAWWEPNGEARASALAMLLEQLAEGDSSSVFLTSGPFILRLCDALPVSQARHFWRVRNLLRRMKS